MTTVLLVVAVLVAVLLLSVLIELRKGGGSGRKDDPNAVSAVITSMSERLTAIQEGLITVEGDVGRLLLAAEALAAVDEALSHLT